MIFGDLLEATIEFKLNIQTHAKFRVKNRKLSAQ